MYRQQPPTRSVPGIISYMSLFSTKKAAYTILISIPLIIAIISFILNSLFTSIWNFFHLFNAIILFYIMMGGGVLLSRFHYAKKSPILELPPHGWSIQLNAFFTAIIGISLLIGQIITIFLSNIAFQEVFFILGTIISYIIAYVIFFSFTTVGKYGNFILALAQPFTAIIFFSIFAAQRPLDFFIKATLFFIVCAIIFAIPYARSLSSVSNVYREAMGIGGYPFIRAFVLSMLTEGNDYLIESFFDQVGIYSDAMIQYLAMRTSNSKELKGLFIIPHIHFGPFKTCGSSDLPEHIYKEFERIKGTTVYHTTNDHSQNLTSQKEVDKILTQIRDDVNRIENDPSLHWIEKISDVSRKMANSAKLIGTEINDAAIIFLTRHPFPSDDIEAKIGEEIRRIAKSKGYQDLIIIDAHNSIIGDEILIKKDSLEAKDLISVADKFLTSIKREGRQERSLIQYSVVKDPLDEFTPKDGIGFGGLIVHLFKNSETGQKTALIHFDANNAYVDIRSYILNMLQNRGIERGEVTTSDSHSVARQFSRRGYSPIGDKIKLENILNKLDFLISQAQQSLEDVEFLYYDSTVKNVKIWGDPKYFDVIMSTLLRVIKVSQGLLTYSLIAPTFFSIILLLFFYNIQFNLIF
jgi:predicted neutral ceramidase superfamily lipid hydrolase